MEKWATNHDSHDELQEEELVGGGACNINIMIPIPEEHVVLIDQYIPMTNERRTEEFEGGK